MRKLIIAAATALSALAISAQAAAQYYPQPRGQSYGYGNYGQVRSYQARVNNLFRVVDQMGRQGMRRGEHYQLRREVGELNYQVKLFGQNGLSQREARELDYRFARVEQMVRGGRLQGQRSGYDGYNGSDGFDRDRDGRDDRYENDRGYDRD